MFNLRNFIFGSIVAGCTVATSANALQCQSEDCEALGYSKTVPSNCERTIKCPYDDTYVACVQLKDEFTDGECPTGYTCETKYKATGCTEGYNKLSSNLGFTCVNTCTGMASKPNDHFVYSECTDSLGKKLYTKTDLCETGYVISKDGSSCYNETCVLDSNPHILGANIGETSSGKYIVLSCQKPYLSALDKSGCISDCTDKFLPANECECYDNVSEKCCDPETCEITDSNGTRKCVMSNQIDTPLI